MSRQRGSGNRDIGLSSNGKGSASRITDDKAYAENFDAIDWGRPKILTDKDACDCCGEPKQPGEAPFVPVVATPLPVEGPGTIAYPHGYSEDPEIPAGWRKLEWNEEIKDGDYYEARSPHRWAPCQYFDFGSPAEEYRSLAHIRRVTL